MDTTVDILWDKCVKCYKCVELCTETYKNHGILGFLRISIYNGYPDCWEDNMRCHHCKAIVDGKETPYACNKICEHNAMKIRRR